jgi:hypothetical protein
MRNRSKQGNPRRFKRLRDDRGHVIDVISVPPPRNDAEGSRGRAKRDAQAEAAAQIAKERKVEPSGKRLEEDEARKLFKLKGHSKPTLTHSKYDPRDASTYRGAKRNAARGPRAQKGDVEVHGPPGEPKAFAWVQPWKGPHPPKPKNWWKRSA